MPPVEVQVEALLEKQVEALVEVQVEAQDEAQVYDTLVVEQEFWV